jgi:uncharacterized protein (DUF169 family)
MKKSNTHLAVFNKIGLTVPPVGVKFLFFKPEGIRTLAKTKVLSFCEMLIEAQKSNAPFYISKANEQACIGRILLGMDRMEPFAESGQIGPGLGMFQEPRANYAFYKVVPRFDAGIVNYVAFSPLDKLNFDPDVLIITAKPAQAEIVMRAMTYSTGELYNSRTTPVMGCAWLYIYPFQSGQVNYIVPALVHGMGGRRLAPEDAMFISIPYQWLPTITKNLGEMKIHLTSHVSKEKYLAEFEEVVGGLVEEAKSP